MAALLAVALLLPAVARASPVSLPQLMAMLARVPARHANFQEDRHIAQLTAPVHDSGTLDYVRPSRLEKHTTAPHDERLVVDGDKLWIVRAGQPTRYLDLSDQPEISSLVDIVRGTLAGDLAALQRSYTVALGGDLESWQLTLTPDARLAGFLRVVHIDGAGTDLHRIEMVQANGDSTQMTISSGT
jgi:outer membrane lipoprotein-sorting protein